LFWDLTCDFWAENEEKNKIGRFTLRDRLPFSDTAVAISLILRGVSLWNVLRLVLSPEIWKAFAMKIETYLLLMLGIAVVLIIGTLLYDRRDLLKYFLPRHEHLTRNISQNAQR
jgi:hypothetical protein